MTVVGTRPEIIRLSQTIKLLDQVSDHILVHTGQNYDRDLNEVFFDGLGLRRPDYLLEAKHDSLGQSLGSIISEVEGPLLSEKPDAFLVLGDTNSAVSALVAKRLGIPVFHMEAGNRCFDDSVPEETNRRMVDHIADFNLVYTEHARRNLIAEGLHPSRILLTGSPMKEVLDAQPQLTFDDEQSVLDAMAVERDSYFLVSLHRQETVDTPAILEAALRALSQLSAEYDLPVIISTHPRTRKRLEAANWGDLPGLAFHPPFDYQSYLTLQMNSRLVLSDSGTISEEASLLGFRAVTLRQNIERPEALDAGTILTTGLSASGILEAARFILSQPAAGLSQAPAEYLVNDFSQRVTNFVFSKVLASRG